LKVFIYVLLFVFVSCLWKDKVEPIPAMNAQEYTHFTNYTNKSLQASSKDLKILSKKKYTKQSPTKFFEQEIFIRETFYDRIGDCQEYPPIPDPVPLIITSKSFNFLSKSSYLSFGLLEHNGWPILIGYKFPKKIEKKHRIILAFRGDRSGFHRTSFTDPLLEYYKTQREEEASILFLEALIYSTEERDLLSSPLMVLCHYREYPHYGRIGAQWAAMEGGANWEILERLFPITELEYEIISYSNGNLPRSEFIKRNAKKNHKFISFNPEKETPSEFIQKYRESTELANKKSKNIKGLIDFEGHYFAGKPVWDLAAFLLDEVESDTTKYYYSINRIEEDKVHQNTVFLIQALELEGIEEENGVIRYTNKNGNIVFDVVTSTKPSYYSSYGVDLKETTKFQPSKAPNRILVNHGTVVELGFSRFEFK